MIVGGCDFDDIGGDEITALEPADDVDAGVDDAGTDAGDSAAD